MENLNTFEDIVALEQEICKNLKIQDIAEELLGQPVLKKNKNIKWNITYKTFYKPEKTPSFKISERYQIFYCFSTKHSGNVVTLYRDFLNLATTKQACEQLVEKYHLKISYKKVNEEFTDIEKDLINFFEWISKLAHYNLYLPKYKHAYQYLKERDIDQESIDIFNLGYIQNQEEIDKVLKNQCKNLNKEILQELHIFDEFGNFKLLKRIIIPIYDINGNIISMTGRDILPNSDLRYKELSINDDYKDVYRNFAPKKHLYNLNKAKHYINVDNELILVEGYFDVIRLNSIGVHNVVAALTTSLTVEQKKILEKLNPLKLTILFDGDDSGVTRQNELLYELSSIKANGNSHFLYRHTFFIDNSLYLENKADPDMYFKEKKLDDWIIFVKDKMDFRINYIKEYINKYANDSSILIDELNDEIGDFINLYSPNYIDDLEKIIRDKKLGDLENFLRLFQCNDNIQSLYLMNKLNAEQFYCLKLLNDSKNFINEFRCYNYFMNEIYDELLNLPDTEIKYYQSINNRKLYGDRSSKIVIDVFNMNEIKLYTFELDFLSGYLYMFRRFSENNNSNKRNENNFFDAKIFTKIEKNEVQKKVLNYIRREIIRNDNVVDKKGEDSIND